jgi:hypothetical protein
MTIHPNKLSTARFEPAGKVLQAALHQWTRTRVEDDAPPPRVFVTVSRQPGAGGISFSHRLAQRLNDAGAGDWSAWDHELVERVSAEHHIPIELIEMIPDRHRSWLTSLVDAISNNPQAPDFAEVRAYKRVVTAIRALAEQGHAIIVGQGGTFVTEGMPGAIHLRLVAPLEHRIKHVSDREHLTLHEAAARITEVDAHRAEFFRNFWHRREIRPEQFTLTLNSGELTVDAMVDAVLQVIRSREKSLGGRNSADHQPLSAGPR